MTLKGKTALITGATAGIGWQTALELASKGAEVLAIGRRRDRLQKLESEFPKLIKGLVVDITKDLTPLQNELKKTRVDILINNAGLALGRGSFEKIPKEDWKTMFATNVEALIEVTQLIVPSMLERQSGDIVNVGSIAGMHAYAGGSVYSATKAAVEMLTDAWRLDFLGKGIRVMGIHPGMVETEFSIVRYRGDKEEAKKVYAGLRALQPKDIAEAIAWSLERPAHVNIQTLLIMPTDQGGVGAVFRKN